MNRESIERFAPLFEPVVIGPVTAKNRFYQAPHCNGMGNLRPRAHAAMRGVKAEGGWAVVNTEHCSVHPSSDLMPEVLQTLWDDGDIEPLRLMVDAVHAHDALAGVQLAYAANYNANLMTRIAPMGPLDRPVSRPYPVQVRAMDRRDIADLRTWFAAAARRAVRAGFDIVNVDANFSTVAFQFLSRSNTRGYEYGGSLANRARLLRELIEVTGEAVAGKAAVSVRLIIDEMRGADGMRAQDEGIEAISLMADLPDLWDIVIGTWADDSPTARFASENAHEPYMRGIRAVTSRPVVGVGRFTSPDTMLELVRRGVLDMIGAARPSIADPFLPEKIRQGRVEDIRECIGCNICVSSHYAMTHLRCTQNPTMGEEWRSGWHPERVPAATRDTTVLVVGAGPAGLEAARTLGQRGYRVALAERRRELGGRVSLESALPGLATWARVRDWRTGQIARMDNVEVYPGSDLGPGDILSMGFAHVVLAVGARWRADGLGRRRDRAIPAAPGATVLTPDDLMAGRTGGGRVLIYDDDHYYMGSVLAEKLARNGRAVTLVTPAAEIAAFTAQTLELEANARRLHGLGVSMLTHHEAVSIAPDAVMLRHVHTGVPRGEAATTVVLVTARSPETALYDALDADPERLREAGIESLARIGDCHAPAAIVHAVYDGHRYARGFGGAGTADTMRRERIDLAEAECAA